MSASVIATTGAQHEPQHAEDLQAAEHGEENQQLLQRRAAAATCLSDPPSRPTGAP